MRTTLRPTAVKLTIPGDPLGSIYQRRPMSAHELNGRLDGWKQRLVDAWTAAGSPRLEGIWRASVVLRRRQPSANGNLFSVCSLILAGLTDAHLERVHVEVSEQEEPAMLVLLEPEE